MSRRQSLINGLRNGLIVRLVVIIYAGLPCRLIVKRVKLPIGRDNCPIRQFHHQSRIVEAAIGVNEQARKLRRHQGTIQFIGNTLCHFKAPMS